MQTTQGTIEQIEITAFAERLAELRAALADADPLNAPPMAEAQGVAGGFARATASTRARGLLRALDDAIVAIEVAINLAEAQASQPAPAASDATPRVEAGALAAAYAAFIESQPGYQALYHYRNALAATLREQARPLPATAAAPTTPGAPTEASSDEA